MGLFRSEAQKNAVLLHLCGWTGNGRLWSAPPTWGPSEWAAELVRADRSAATGEVAIARIVHALWEGRGQLTFGDLLADLDVEPRQALNSLLEALLDGPDSVDSWVEEHGREGHEDDFPLHAEPAFRKTA